MSANPPATEGRKEACKTYIEQTNLLVTLASAFLFAPAGLIAIAKDRPDQFGSVDAWLFIGVEALFVLSVLSGYVTLGALTGSQDAEKFDVFDWAVRGWSLAQFALYVLGIVVFIVLAARTLLESANPVPNNVPCMYWCP
jgi:hypothetical protein